VVDPVHHVLADALVIGIARRFHQYQLVGERTGDFIRKRKGAAGVIDDL